LSEKQLVNVIETEQNIQRYLRRPEEEEKDEKVIIQRCG
jgi:hypothetical protein